MPRDPLDVAVPPLDGYGPRLRALRLKLGLGQEKFAALLGIRKSALSSCETGKRPTPPAVRRQVEVMEKES